MIQKITCRRLDRDKLNFTINETTYPSRRLPGRRLLLMGVIKNLLDDIGLCYGRYDAQVTTALGTHYQPRYVAGQIPTVSNKNVRTGLTRTLALTIQNYPL